MKDKVVLITGAGQGIGRALSIDLAKGGSTVILVGKTLKKLESVYDEIVALGAPEPAIYPINLLNMTPEHANECVENTRRLFGRLDVLIHHAGISGPICQVDHLAPHQWQQVVHLNLNVPYLLTHAFLPLLRQTAHSKIIFTVADEASHPKAYWSAYSASKSGLVAFAQSLHEELEANTTISVHCINPGKVRTAFRMRAYPGIEPESLTAPEKAIESYRSTILA